MITKAKLNKLKAKTTPEIKAVVADEKGKSIAWIERVLNGIAPDHHDIIPRIIQLVTEKAAADQKKAKALEIAIDQLD